MIIVTYTVSVRGGPEATMRPNVHDVVPGPMIGAERTRGLSSLGRALRLLETFDASTPELSVRELARLSGIARSTTHRLVTELVQWGALERSSGGVRLGVRLFQLGALATAPRALRDVALPYAQRLHEMTRLTVSLAVRDRIEIVCFEQVCAIDRRVAHTPVGGRAPMHATALGKAILAFSGREVVESVLRNRLEQVTALTITDEPGLRRELAEIRRRKVAFDREECRAGQFCVAAPIVSRAGHVLGAISVTGVSADVQADLLRSAVQLAADAIGVGIAARGRES